MAYYCDLYNWVVSHPQENPQQPRFFFIAQLGPKIEDSKLKVNFKAKNFKIGHLRWFIVCGWCHRMICDVVKQMVVVFLFKKRACQILWFNNWNFPTYFKYL